MTYRRGSRGEMVLQIQKALAGAGLKVIPDGIFGAITEEAVKEFQRKKGITADGIVGVKTLSLLIPVRWKKSKRSITEIIVHCTATQEGLDYTVDDIRRWHRGRGFTDVGYHYIVYRSGSVVNGRDVDTTGAHCTGHNTHSIGVCYVGGLDRDGKTAKDTRTLAQKAALLSLLTDLRRLYPSSRIIGHRDTSPDKNGNGTVEPFEWIKACPCFDVKKEYVKV